MQFELLDHPADIGFRARAATLTDVFVACASALQSIILDPANIASTQELDISASGADLDSLLVNWLNEILYYIDSKRLALGQIVVQAFTGTSIAARAQTECRDPDKHPPRVVVKAVTYHQLVIEQRGNEWIAEVYVDV